MPSNGWPARPHATRGSWIALGSACLVFAVIAVPALAAADAMLTAGAVGAALSDDEFKQGEFLYFDRCSGCHGALRKGATGPNITDEQIKACADTGGVIGVNGVGLFLSEDMYDTSAPKIFRHIDHIAELVGAEHIGLGLDHVPGMDEPLPVENVVPGYNMLAFSIVGVPPSCCATTMPGISSIDT